MASERRDGGQTLNPQLNVAEWSIGPIVLRLDEPRVFLWKAASVLILSFSLFPLLAFKSRVPAATYVGALVALHIAVLGVYVYRVRFRELAASRRQLVVRVIALLVVSYLLVIVSRFDPDSSWATLGLQMIGVTVFHAALLALVMVQLRRQRY